MSWDLFIGHATEDKGDVARPLADRLKAWGYKVWYDEYTLTVGGTGAAAGGAAFVPGVGTVASLATGAAEAIAALDASVLYTLAVAEVHGLALADVERRRTLVAGLFAWMMCYRIVVRRIRGELPLKIQ